MIDKRVTWLLMFALILAGTATVAVVELGWKAAGAVGLLILAWTVLVEELR